MNITEILSKYGSQYVTAFFTTWKLTLISFAAALIIGILITVMRVCPIKPLRTVGNLYVQIFRNIPGAVLLIFLVYAMPYLNIVFPYFTCVIIAMILIPSAFCSEYIVSGINTIDIGQIEAAKSLGMTFSQLILKVVLPLALRASVLPLTNLFVATMLSTSLASQVPVKPYELTGLVSHINTHAVGGVTAFFISAMLYCISGVVIGQIGNFIDKKVRIKR